MSDSYQNELVEEQAQLQNVKRALAESSIPLKDDKWIEAMVRQSLVQAAQNGQNRIGFTNADNQVQLYSDNYRELYENTYNKKVPKILNKIARQYGGEVKKVQIDDPAFEGKNFMLELPEEAMQKISEFGTPILGKTGNGILDNIA